MPANSTHDKFLARYFAYKHLPAHLQAISAPFCELAEKMVAKFSESGVDGAEGTVMLRKLLEAKDCAVRAFLPDPK
jgi:hypothetical protein